MTNKKFKVAAMSVALTACVAAQPLIANAADETSAVPSDNSSEPTVDTVSSTSDEAGTSAQPEPEEIKNEESKESVSTIGGEDVTVDYDHKEDKVSGNEDGSTTTDSTGTVNRDAPREETPDDPGPAGNTDDNQSEDGKPDGTGKDEKEVVPPSDNEKKPIGTAEKSETESKETDLVLGETTTETTTTTNQDGSTTTTTTTTTDASLETTTNVKGEASAKTDETFHEDVKDTLKEELGGKELGWNTETGTTYGDYTVKEVGAEEDGKKQFTLTKEDKEETGEMTGEDIAKLIEAGYTDNGDGTYTLTREYTDSKGQKQTTTIKVDSSSATKTTSTTLTITLENQKHTTPEESFGDKDKPYDGISEDITVKGDNGKEYKFNLKDILDKAEDKDGTLTYEDAASNLTYTIKKKENSEALDDLSNTELRDLLNERTGGTSYSVDKDGNLCYTTDKGEVCRVTEEQNTLLRSFLELDITITDHHGKESETKVDGSGKTPDEAKTDAQKEAQEKALRDALAKAIEKETGKKPTDAEIDLSKAKDGKFEWTDEATKKTYTFTYTEKGTVSKSEKTDKDGASSAEKNTENATAEVTGSTVIWTEEGQTHTDDNIKDLFGDGYDFTKETNDKLKLEGTASYNEDGTLKSFTTTDGKTYTFEYSQGTAPEGLSDISNAQFKNVKWTVTKKKETTKDEAVTGETVSVIKKNFEQTEKNGAYDFRIGDMEYTGLTKNADGTFSRKNADGTTTVISIDSSAALTQDEVQKELEARGYTDITFYEDGTISYTTASGEKYKGGYNSTVENITVKEIGKSESLVASGSSKEEAQNELLDKIEAARKDLKDGESLLFDGKYEFTKDTEYEEIVTIVKKVINYAVNFEELDQKALLELLQNQKADADAAGKSYDGKTYTWYRGSDGKFYRKDLVEDTRVTVTGQGKHEKTETQIKVDGNWITVTGTYTDKNNIGHLDLATDSDLTLSDNTPTDAILLREGMKFEWNKNAQDLIDGKGNTEAKFLDKISYDDAGDHYEYPRGSWNEVNWIAPKKDQYPTESAFYKLTGTVAYDSLEDGKEYRSEWEARKALEDYKKAHPDEKLDETIVTLYKDQNYSESNKVYKVYLHKSSLTTYGYMSKDSNTCANSSYGKTNQNYYKWAGGFDLRIGDLTQVDEKHITAHGKDVYNCTGTLSKVTKKLDEISKELNLIPTSKTVTGYEDKVIGSGSGLFGSYDQNRYEETPYESAFTGSGSSDYTTYRTWEDATASWSDILEKITGAFQGSYTSTADAKVAEAVKETTVHTESEVKYHYSYVEREELDPIIEIKTVTTTPDGGDITEENTPDSPVLPGNPELPPVQDARPDAPVLPSDPVLPPVQDARIDAALPQTGVNWLGAIGLAFSGMTLMAVGAWASLTGKKAKH